LRKDENSGKKMKGENMRRHPEVSRKRSLQKKEEKKQKKR